MVVPGAAEGLNRGAVTLGSDSCDGQSYTVIQLRGLF